jgi:hypothetical protein
MRPHQAGNSLMYPASVTGRLRCAEKVQRQVLLAEPARLASRLERTSPRLRVGDYAALVEYDPACRSAPRSWCGKSAL